MEGTYTADKRVIKDGVLMCFEGQEMTMAEAERLGLVSQKKAATKQTASGTQKKATKKTAPKQAAAKQPAEGEAEQSPEDTEPAEGEAE